MTVSRRTRVTPQGLVLREEVEPDRVRRCPWGHEVRRPPTGEQRCYCVTCGWWYWLRETHER